MTIWHLIICMCFSMPIAGAAVSAKLARVGLGGWVLALCVGSVIGVCFGAAMWYGMRAIWNYSQRNLPSGQNRYVVAAYLAVIPLLFVAGLIGLWISSAILRLIT